MGRYPSRSRCTAKRRRRSNSFAEPFGLIQGGLHPSVVGPEITFLTRYKDPEDDRDIETALMGFADVFVTGDKAIVELKSVGDLKIETTSVFLARFSRK